MLELLNLARSRIAQGWCQGSSAQDAFGRRCLPEVSRACKWCIFGALYENVESGRVLAVRHLESFLPVVNGLSLVLWNDTPGRTQTEVLELLDKAIASL